MRLSFFVILFFSFGIYGQTDPYQLMQPGKWLGQLAMNDRLFIPFSMEISSQKTKLLIEIVNGDERIPLQLIAEKDSIIGRFPELDAYLKFKPSEEGNEIRGYWLNLSKNSF
jgi:hypothetical protein